MEQSLFAYEQRSDNFRLIQSTPINSVSELRCTLTRKLFEWWSSFTPDLPQRSDFDIASVPSLASNIYLIEKISSGKYLYRLCGNKVGQLIGNHYRMVDISLTSEPYEDRQLAKYLDEISKTNSPSRCRGNLSFVDREFITFESLDCPLFDSDGNITHYLGVICETR
ncbi:PAS domain-containing protein [Sneathiella glossodoripedis]|uniref:PAS domain-containing protein n=1 Tax=Sneathiella glossodoripedis TaxID=418853 RepID=UPI00047225A0|nr:PAS domain-containing protein [Sneathiella glossodoripedis]